MQMLKKTFTLALAFAWTVAPAFADEGVVIGKALSDAMGHGVISAPVDPSLDGPKLVDDVTKELKLTHSGMPRLVSVDQGNLTIEFEAAEANTEIEAILPEAVVRRLAASAPAAVDALTSALIGGGALLVTGGVLGGLAASGKFDGDRVFSSIR